MRWVTHKAFEERNMMVFSAVLTISCIALCTMMVQLLRHSVMILPRMLLLVPLEKVVRSSQEVEMLLIFLCDVSGVW